MEEIKLLVLRLTERCNLRCAYCYAAREDRAEFDMSEQTALRAVELCCPPGGSLQIQFTGGEPLLRLELMEAVAAYGKETGRKLVLSVQTNGTLLTPEVCRRLKQIRCGVGVSLDGIREANALRVFPDGTESYDVVLRGIRNLGEVGMRCGLTSVVTKTSARYLGMLPDLALWLGNVAGIGLDLFRPLGRGAGADLAPNEEILNVGLKTFRERAALLQKEKVPLRFRELARIEKRKADPTGCTYCYAQTNHSLAVDGKGDCWPCSSLAGQREYWLGNLNDGLPTQNSKAESLAAPESCGACPRFSLCRGGCPAGRIGMKECDRMTCAMHHALAGAEE